MTDRLNNKKAGAASTAAGQLDTEFVHPVSSDSLKVGPSPVKNSNEGKPHNENRCEEDPTVDNKCLPTLEPKSTKVLPKKPVQTKIRGKHSSWKELIISGQCGLPRWDEFTLANMIERNGIRVILDEVEITRIQYACESAGCARMVFKKLEQFLKLVARENSFNSAQEMLSNLPQWDGIKRVERFLPTYLGTHAGAYEHATGRYWLTACVARILDPGCKADMLPVLVGGRGTNRFTCLQNFVPAPGFWVEACLTDSPRQLTQKVIGKLLVIWDDMAGIRNKPDADKVKTFISSPVIALTSRHHPGMDQQRRYFTLVATSRRIDFLRDPATYGRYLPFEIGKIDIEGIKRDMPQIWAEALSMVLERQCSNVPLVDYKDAEHLAQFEYSKYIYNKHNSISVQPSWTSNAQLMDMLRRGEDKFTTADALASVGLTGKTAKLLRDKMAAELRKVGFQCKQTRVEGKRLRRWRNPTL